MRRILLIVCFCFLSVINASSQNEGFRIIVFDFETISSKLNESDGKILADALRTSLKKTILDTNVKILEREQIAKLYFDRSKASKMPGIYDKKTAIEIGKFLEANYVLIGKVTQSDLFEGTRISASIVEIKTGVIISSGEKIWHSKSQFDNIILEITKELEKSLQFNHKEINLANSKLEESIKSIVEVYKNKFDLNNCYGHGRHSDGYYNGIVFYPSYSDYAKFVNDAMSISSINPGSPIIGIIHDEIFGEYNQNNFVSNSVRTKENIINVVVNTEGIYWQIIIGSAPCDCEFYNKRENLQESGGLKWAELSLANIEIVDTLVQHKVKTNFFDYQKISKDEIRDYILTINKRVIAGKSELYQSCLNIFEFKNLLHQLKSVSQMSY